MADLKSWQIGFSDALLLMEREFPETARKPRFRELRKAAEQRRARDLLCWLDVKDP